MHSKIEHVLTEELGDLGKKIHTARSRNDQVLVATHLYLKEEISAIKKTVIELFDLLIQLAQQHQKSIVARIHTSSSCNAFIFWNVVFGLCRKFD